MSPKQIIMILWRRTPVILWTLLVTVMGAALVIYLVPPRYDAQATATIDPAQTDPVTGQAGSIMSIRFTQGNMVALVRSQRVAAEVVRRLGLTSNAGLVERYRASGAAGRVDLTDWIAAELLRSIEARFAEGTNVLTITYRWSNGPLAAQLANVFMAAFIDEAIQVKVAGANQTAQWFEPQTEKLRAEVEELREKVNEFQRTARLAPVTTNDTEMALLNQLTNDLGNVRAEKLKIESLLAEYDAAKGAELPANPFESALLQSLKSSLATSTADLSKLQAELGSRNPRVLALDATIRSLQAQIIAEQKNARSNLEVRLASLNAQVGVLDKARAAQVDRLIEVQNQRNRMAQLVKDLEVKQERLNAAARQAAAAQMQGQLSFSNISILDKAVAPVAPAFPRTMIVMPVAVAIGLALGTLFALILEALDRRVRTTMDLDYATQVPSLGQLLSTPTRRSLVPSRVLIPSMARQGPR